MTSTTPGVDKVALFVCGTIMLWFGTESFIKSIASFILCKLQILQLACYGIVLHLWSPRNFWRFYIQFNLLNSSFSFSDRLLCLSTGIQTMFCSLPAAVITKPTCFRPTSRKSKQNHLPPPGAKRCRSATAWVQCHLITDGYAIDLVAT